MTTFRTMRARRAIDGLIPSVVTVGHGRGFVVECGHDRAVITAAHCLPSFPPCRPDSYRRERTYGRLLSALGAKPTVWAECLFADPIADIAVLGTPDGQELYSQAEAYEQLVGGVTPLSIAHAPKQSCQPVQFGDLEIERRTSGGGSALVLSLEGEWIKCSVTRNTAWLSLEPQKFIRSGMSGSPIILANGRAIGLVSVSQQSPVLMDSIPGRFLRHR